MNYETMTTKQLETTKKAICDSITAIKTSGVGTMAERAEKCSKLHAEKTAIHNELMHRLCK